MRTRNAVHFNERVRLEIDVVRKDEKSEDEDPSLWHD
jgi:hypothetical protein